MAKKRANGEGSIRKRKDGRWEGRYTAGHDPDTGKAIIKNVLGRTQTEAKQKLKEAIAVSEKLDIPRSGKYTLGAWIMLRQQKAVFPESEYIFSSPVTGEMYHPDSVVNLHKKILKEAGLEHIRFHDLRHTFATLALQNGVDVKTVSAMLGHSNAGFTLATYTHTTTAAQHQAQPSWGALWEALLGKNKIEEVIDILFCHNIISLVKQ